MELKNILELMKAFDASEIHSLKLEQDKMKLSLEKKPEEKVVITKPKEVSEIEKVMPRETLTSKTQQQIQEEEIEKFKLVKSPIVGTFYSAPSPDAAPFVKKGDIIKKGQVLCIIEAMKLMNDIESEYDGEVVEVLVQNEEMVEYGQPLFKIKD